MNFTLKQTKLEGRTRIEVSATPKTKETRALLREFQAGARELEKKWKAIVRAHAKAEKEAAAAKRAR